MTIILDLNTDRLRPESLLFKTVPAAAREEPLWLESAPMDTVMVISALQLRDPTRTAPQPSQRVSRSIDPAELGDNDLITWEDAEWQ